MNPSSYSPSIGSPLFRLKLSDYFHGSNFGSSGYSTCRETGLQGIKSSQISPQLTLHMGDQVHNVRAAQAFGMHAIRVGPLEEGFELASISRLEDLPVVLPWDGANR